MKVLLILTNKHLGWSISRSLLIWIATCLVGSAIHCAIFKAFPLHAAFGLSLLFSSPVLLLAGPTLYYLPSLHSISSRIGVSSTVILIACLITIGIVAIVFNLPYELVAMELSPFVPSAAVCFFLFTRKQLFAKHFSAYAH